MKQILKQWGLNESAIKQWMMVLIAVSFLVVILLFNFFRVTAENNRPMPVKAQQAQLPDVEVVSVLPAQYKAKVVGYGEATPHYVLTLTAQVNGQIEALNKHFESGHRVKKGETLVQLEDSQYQAAVATAENNVAVAKLALLEEQRTVAQAKAEWQASGLEGEPDSELVLHQPQLKAAAAAVKQAEVGLLNAKKDLDRTKIVAPFDALVVERQVSPGSFVQASTAVASLYSTERVEIKINLSTNDWQNLPNISASKGLPVKLSSVEGKVSWVGHLLRVEQHLDDSTRQRALIVTVNQPLDQVPALYPGTFLNAEVEGRTVEKLWKLPSSALSQRGEIWYVTQDNTLANFSADPVFSDSEAIYIATPESLVKEKQRVLVHPLSSYLKGMQVKVIAKVNNHG
ncbi:MAG: efflux RND transporter periplasmic adaptor subunit [Methylophilaceae bacterium]